jgi:hypothetical protein
MMEIATHLRQRPARIVALVTVPLAVAVIALISAATGPARTRVAGSFAARSPTSANSPVADRQAAEAIARAAEARGLSAHRDGTSVRLSHESLGASDIGREEMIASARVAIADVYRPAMEGAEAGAARAAGERDAAQRSLDEFEQQAGITDIRGWHRIHLDVLAVLRSQRDAALAAGDPRAAGVVQARIDSGAPVLEQLERLAPEAEQLHARLDASEVRLRESGRKVEVLERRASEMHEELAANTPPGAQASPMRIALERAAVAAAVALLCVASALLVASAVHRSRTRRKRDADLVGDDVPRVTGSGARLGEDKRKVVVVVGEGPA